ncbi:MAG: hydrogenase maturation nickel metallochaperone HypA [Smithella sp.]
MHELPVIQSILDVVLNHARMNQVSKVHSISLAIGELSDLQDEWLQRYFDYISKGTLAEGARLVIERTPVVLKCASCAKEIPVKVGEMKDIVCPVCGNKELTLIAGREYFIKSMEAQ